jgi:hypothetical protein
MTLLKICHGVLLNDVVEFMLRWGTGQFVDSVAERLRKVARKTGA